MFSKLYPGNSLVIQWLGLHASTAGKIPDWGDLACLGAWPKKIKLIKKNKTRIHSKQTNKQQQQQQKPWEKCSPKSHSPLPTNKCLLTTRY